MRTPQEQRLFNTYRNIQQVVYNINNPSYKRARAAGVNQVEDIGSFDNFASWVITKLGPEPFPGARIIRRDQTQGYTRRNLIWGSHQDQGRNLRHCVRIRFRGKTQNIRDWSDELGIPAYILYARRYRGITKPRELFKAVR